MQVFAKGGLKLDNIISNRHLCLNIAINKLVWMLLCQPIINQFAFIFLSICLGLGKSQSSKDFVFCGLSDFQCR